MLKNGDKLYCFNPINNVITLGKYYTIVGIDEYYEILDDNNKIHYFSYDKYEDFFITIKELRKQKLEKLEKIQKCFTLVI